MEPNPLAVSSEPLARRVAVALAKIGLALRSRAWREAGERGLSPTQGQILSTLRLRPEGAMAPSALAEALAVTPATVSDAVRALAEKGLVARERSPDDGRSLQVVLTAAGRAEADRAAGWPDFLASAAEALAPAEQEAFLRALVVLMRTLQERGEIPVSAMCVTCRYFRPNVHADPRRPHHCAFVDAPFGDGLLRIDCPDHQPASPAEREQTWRRFVGAGGPSP